jgi:hypothetical protein
MRALLVLLAGCWSGPKPQPPPKPAPNNTVLVCNKDQLFETVCGSVAAPNETGTCGPMGDSLLTYGKTKVVISFGTGVEHDPAWKNFPLDNAATLEYRKELDGKVSVPENHCCYSRCTQLVVAKTAPPIGEPPPTHKKGELCIPPPPAGTNAPHAQVPSCPAALDLQGNKAPYRGPLKPTEQGARPWWFHGESCCYTALLRTES